MGQEARIRRRGHRLQGHRYGRAGVSPQPVEATSFEDALRAYEANPSDPEAYSRVLERAAAEPEAAQQLLLQRAESAPRAVTAPEPPPAEPPELEEPSRAITDPHA